MSKNKHNMVIVMSILSLQLIMISLRNIFIVLSCPKTHSMVPMVDTVSLT